MTTELEKVIAGEGGSDTPPAPAAEDPKDPPEPAETTDPEVLKREEQLANINKAIEEGNEELSKIRKDKKELKGTDDPDDTDDVPEFNEDDPNVRALDKRIDRKTGAIESDVERGKAEVRTFALREFLSSNPALARQPAKVREMMRVYEQIKTATERTAEGVILDLRRAAATVFYDQILPAANRQRINQAEADEEFSAPAVGTGATGYRVPRDASGTPKLSSEDKAILAKWGQTPEQWAEDYKNHGQHP